jgi:hypothetical protein
VSDALGHRTPRYGERSLAELLPSVVAHLGGATSTLLPLPTTITSVVVLVVDGLGAHLLQRHADVAPILASAPSTVLDAAFPAATATNLTTIGTGAPPAVHGVVGTAVRVPGPPRLFHPLTWRWDSMFDGPDALGDVAPERFQPHEPVFARARAMGLDPTVVVRPEFAGSGLTRAALRGAPVVTAPTLPETLATALAACEAGHALVYGYHPDLDTAGHVHGPESEPWRSQLAELDAEVGRAVARAPDHVAVLVTADHGMVAVPEEGFLDVAERPELLDGVVLLAGDPRARQLHVRDGALDAVRVAWRETLGARALVLTRDEVLARGWFGPPDAVTPTVGARIGDLLVVAGPGVGVVNGAVDPRGGRLPGQHAAPTDEELEVPALVLTRSTLP